jgi:hypothetical protein
MAAFAVPPIFKISIFVKAPVKPEVMTKIEKISARRLQRGSVNLTFIV